MPSRETDAPGPRPAPVAAPSLPGDRTDRFALPGESVYVPRAGYLVVRTPERPDHAHGHRLILAEPPEPGTLAQWIRLWHREQAGHAHVDLAILQFEAESLVDVRRDAPPRTLWLRCLAAESIAEPLPTRVQTELRVLDPDSDAEWEEAIRLSVAANGVDIGLTEWIYASWRARVRAGRGTLHGLFHGARLVACCGVFRSGDEGRFQDVCVHPGFQQLGLGGRLVADAARAALAAGLHRVWIVCEQGAHAERLYRRLGFEPHSELGEIAVAVRGGPRRRTSMLPG